jgi:hypothetical protein
MKELICNKKKLNRLFLHLNGQGYNMELKFISERKKG